MAEQGQSPVHAIATIKNRFLQGIKEVLTGYCSSDEDQNSKHNVFETSDRKSKTIIEIHVNHHLQFVKDVLIN